MNKINNNFNYNLLILWQGRFVSILGDSIYSLALGFIILNKTNSTAIMSSIISVSMIFKIIASLFSGSICDRLDKKNIIIVTDLIRGVTMLILAALIFGNSYKIWMYFLVGIIVDICSAFFNPTIHSILPKIIEKNEVSQANAKMDLARFLADIIGTSIGGLLYSSIKSGFLVVINGISYIFSAITELFLKIPKDKAQNNNSHILNDIRDGYTYIWNNKGLRFFLIFCSSMNLFLSLAQILFLPLFKSNILLGVEKYGFSMACFSLGIVIGTILLSLNKITFSNRCLCLIMYSLLFSLIMSIFPMMNNWILVSLLLLAGGIVNSFTQNIIISSLQLNIKSDMMGRVFAAYSMILNVLKPLGCLIGGLLGEVLNIGYIISISFIINLILVIMFMKNQDLRAFISLDCIDVPLANVD